MPGSAFGVSSTPPAHQFFGLGSRSCGQAAAKADVEQNALGFAAKVIDGLLIPNDCNRAVRHGIFIVPHFPVLRFRSDQNDDPFGHSGIEKWRALFYKHSAALRRCQNVACPS